METNTGRNYKGQEFGSKKIVKKKIKNKWSHWQNTGESKGGRKTRPRIKCSARGGGEVKRSMGWGKKDLFSKKAKFWDGRRRPSFNNDTRKQGSLPHLSFLKGGE